MSVCTVNLEQMRPMLRRDVHFADIGDGVYLRHTDDSMVLKGAVIYRWVATLAPYLTGDATVAELTADLPAGQRDMAYRIIGALLERGFARATTPSETPLSEEVQERFGPQVRYIEHFVDDAAARFLRFREASIRVLADEDLARALSTTLQFNGARQVEEVAPADGWANTDLLVASADLLGLGGLADTVGQALAAGVAVLPVVVWDGVAYMGPIFDGNSSASLRSLYWRMTGNLEPRARSAFWEQLNGSPAAATAFTARGPAAMIGSMLAYETFRYLTGCITPETLGHVVIQNLHTLDSHTERLLRHPVDETPNIRTASALVAGVDELVTLLDAGLSRDLPRVSEEMREVAESAMPLISFRLGVFGTIDDREVTQSPLKMARLSVREAEAEGGAVVTGTSVFTPMEARMDAILNASRLYALCWAPRGFDWQFQAPASEWRLWNGMSKDPLAAVKATSVGGDNVLVPLPVLFPTAAGARAQVLPTSAGTGAGFTEVEAIREALLSAVAFDSLQNALRGGVASLVDVDNIVSPAARFLLDAHRELGALVSAATLPGVVPVVLVETVIEGRKHVATAAGTSLTEALAVALQQSLAAWQSDADAPDYGDATFDSIRVGADSIASKSVTWNELLASTDTVLVDITPADLQDIGIHVVRALLRRHVSVEA